MKNSTDKKTYKPIPVQAILDSISHILAQNIGNRFELEIDEKDVENYRGETTHEIEMILTIQEPKIQEPKKNAANQDTATLPKEHLKNSEIPF